MYEWNECARLPERVCIGPYALLLFYITHTNSRGTAAVARFFLHDMYDFYQAKISI